MARRAAFPWVIDGPINGELFTLYVEKVLVPTLAKGDLVILDNLGSHKGASTRSARRAAMKVSVFQWPCGTRASRRSPRGPQPRSGAMLVLTHVSSMKTSRPGSIRP